ncbi:DUF4433 domain-containing protein [Labrys okinawensis]|uniref:type II toxin-antitoxin system toxin DNA ADP-ribosyl transferase DarT n=1 Tax=Labrys okinawensis TaxID=346911 RepID=UPI0039BC692A
MKETSMPAPNPTQLFHITAIDNLPVIGASGHLLSKSILNSAKVNSTSIAHETIQIRRARKVVPINPGGTLHDYVPFYFAPRSPMLFTINNGNVEGCNLNQDDIVHLSTTAQTIVEAGCSTVFTDYHAVMAIAKFYDDLAKLDVIDWELFFESPRIAGYCQFWQNRQTVRHLMRMETRQAEFLVRDSVPLAAITQIGVRSELMANRVRAALANTAWDPEILVVPGWYY